MSVYIYILWFGIVLLVPTLVYIYFNKRLISTSRLSARGKRYARVGLATVFAISFGSGILLRVVEPLVNRISWFSYTMLGVISFVFTFLILRDLIWYASLGLKKVYLIMRKLLSRTPAPQSDPVRREFLLQTSNLGILALAGSLTTYGIFEARRRPGIVNVDVPIRGLPADFDGFRIVQISDIHAGLTVKRDWIEIIVNEIASLKPDLIAFTGDFVDGSVGFLRDHVAPIGELQAPYGNYFVTGNHEYYSDASAWVKEAQRLGYDVLNNEHRLVHRNGSSLIMAGVTDYSGGRFLDDHRSDPEAALDGAPSDTVKILLAHQPRALYKAKPLGYDLLITGHTHGGQFFPWNLVATIGQPYIKGLHNHNGTWIYVSKGTGYFGPPIRLGARSEITVLRLTRKGQSVV
jgi:uncharacterized protein